MQFCYKQRCLSEENHGFKRRNACTFSSNCAWIICKRCMENATKLRLFPCFRGGGCPARVRKPASPRSEAVQPSNEGRSLTCSLMTKSSRIRRIFVSLLFYYIQAFQELNKGFSSVDGGAFGNFQRSFTELPANFLTATFGYGMYYVCRPSSNYL